MARPDQPLPGTSRDIEIRLSRSDSPDGSCRVSITGPDDRRADGLFRSPFTKAEIEQALRWMDLGRPGDPPARARVREFGERLFQALFQGAVAGVYAASRDASAAPRIRLTVDDREAARIPWELLVDPATREALVLRGRFVRGIATEGGARPLVVDPPLRVLVVDSAPRILPRLESQVEARDIADALAGVVAQGRVEVDTLEHATLSTVLDRLREAAQARPPKPFHVLHWIGHGYVDPVTGANVLLFEDEEGNVDRVDGARLANVVVGSDVRLVLINACHSAAPSPSEPATPAAETTRAIAEVLLTAGIPAVVGMRVAVMDDTARRFAREFYAALADGRGVDDAVLDARILVTGRAAEASAEIGVPVAYLRSGSGQLLSGVTPLAWWQVPLVRFRRLTPLARVAVFVLAVIATLAVERSVDAVFSYFERPEQMAGDLRVVVTEFDGQDESGRPVSSEPARLLAEDLARALESDLREELEQQQPRRTVTVRLPTAAGRLTGATAADRAAAAATLADEVAAHVVVYGSLDHTRTRLQPEIYVSEGLLADAEELLGPMRLGPPVRTTAAIDDPGSSAHAQMREGLVTRARALGALILGLRELRDRSYDAAGRYFETAASRWGDAPGREVVYLFRGGAAAVSHRLDDAERWFGEALALSPSYARARMGLAEVAFQRAKGTCERNDMSVDGAGLNHALEEYRAAGTATDDGGAVSALARARLGMARIYACMGQAGIGDDSWAAAEEAATAVISDYEAGDEVLSELAAEAYAVRALTRLPFEGDPNAAAAWQRAEQDLKAAVGLAKYVGRRAAYRAELARVLSMQEGKTDEAREQYERAIFEEPDADDRATYEKKRDALDNKGTSQVPFTAHSARALMSPQPRAVGGFS